MRDNGAYDQQQAEIIDVFRRQETTLIRWLTAKLGDSEAARDVAQDTFIRVWIYSGDRAVRNPRHLIYKTAARQALNELRRRRRFFRRNIFANDLFPTDEACDFHAGGLTPEESAALKQEAAQTVSAIEALPPNPRKAFILHRFEGLNYREIAGHMAVSKSSVEKYMIEARRRLRIALQPERTHEEPKRRRRVAVAYKNATPRLFVSSIRHRAGHS